MKYPTLLFRTFACVLLLAVAIPASADSAPALRPSFHALPERTALVVWFPEPGDVRAALRQRTALGEALFGPDQQARIEAFLSARMGDQGEGIQRYGLKGSDWPNLFNGPAGAAMCLVGSDDGGTFLGGRARLMFLAWIEPEEELAARLMNAAETFFAESSQRGGKAAPRRVDLDMAGYQVTRLTLPVMGLSSDLEAIKTPDDFRDLSQAERQAVLERWRQQRDARELEEINRQYFFLTRVGSRLLMGFAPAQGGDLRHTARRLLDGSANRADMELDELAMLDPLTAMFEKFLVAHGDARAEGFSAKIMRTPGIAELPSGGSVCVEAFADLSLVLEGLAADDFGRVVSRWLSQFGVDQAGPLAWRTVLEGNVLRSGGLFSAPAPRAGLYMCLDQQRPLASEPPPWVPADAASYMHVSLALGGLYDRVKSIAIEKIFGPESANGLEAALADSPVGPDPAVTMSSLGHQHCFVRYAARSNGVDVRRQTQEGADAPVDVPRQRWAWVWQPTDVALSQRLFKLALTRLAADEADPQPAEEQGFTGWRAGHDDMSAALFAGKGYLTLCFGPDVTSRQLNVLAQPPAAEAALLHSPLMQQVRGMMPLGSALGFLVADFGQVMRDRLAYSRAVASGQPPDPDKQESPPGQTIPPVNEAKEGPSLGDLLPPDDQLVEALGALGATVEANDSGLVGRSALWLNPPTADR